MLRTRRRNTCKKTRERSDVACSRRSSPLFDRSRERGARTSGMRPSFSPALQGPDAVRDPGGQLPELPAEPLQRLLQRQARHDDSCGRCCKNFLVSRARSRLQVTPGPILKELRIRSLNERGTGCARGSFESRSRGRCRNSNRRHSARRGARGKTGRHAARTRSSNGLAGAASRRHRYSKRATLSRNHIS